MYLVSVHIKARKLNKIKRNIYFNKGRQKYGREPRTKPKENQSIIYTQISSKYIYVYMIYIKRMHMIEIMISIFLCIKRH